MPTDSPAVFAVTAETWSAWGVWVQALVIGVSAMIVGRQLREARRFRREQSRPYVIVHAPVEQRSMAMLAVENIGQTAASHVRVRFDTAPHNFRGEDLTKLAMFTDGIPTLVPHHAVRAHWSPAHRFYQEDYEHALVYNATVTYSGPDGHEYGPEPYVIDLQASRGVALNAPGISDVAREVEQMRKIMKGWRADAGGGLDVRVLDRRKLNLIRDRPWRLQRARAAYDDGGIVALGRHLVAELRRRHGLHFE